MAVIGFYDADAAKFAPTFFNIDLMKTAAYHRAAGDIVEMMKDLEERWKFSKIYYWQDYPQSGPLPKLKDYPNIEYRGMYVTKNKEEELPPQIEVQEPYTNIYRRYEKKYKKNTPSIAFWGTMNSATHIRMTNEKEVQKAMVDRGVLKGTICIHDLDPTANPTFFKIADWCSDRKVRILTKFPLYFRSYNGFKNKGFEPYHLKSTIYFTSLMEDSDFVDLIRIAKEGRTQLKEGQELVFQIDKFCLEEDFISTVLPKLYNQIRWAIQEKQPFKIEFNPYYFSTVAMTNFMLALAYFLESARSVRKNLSFKDYIYFRSVYDKNISLKVQYLRDAFGIIQKENPEFFEELYLTRRVELKGGELVPCVV